MKEPKTRFPEFTGEWSQNQLNELTSYVDYRGKTPKKTNDGIFLVTAKNIKDGFIDYEVSQEYISKSDYEEVMHRGKPRLGDVLITTEAPCGNVAQVDKVEIALAQRIIKYRGNANIIDNTYLKYCLLAPEFQKSLMINSSGGTVQGIKGSVLHQQKIMYPCYAEQQKIASLFTELDTLIQSAEKELDSYKELKQGMLQKMLPKKGEKVPEIRFPEYSGEWGQCKVGEITKFHKQGFYTTEEYDENKKYYLLRGTDLARNKLILKDTPKVNATDKDFNAFKVEVGDFLIVRSGTVGTYRIVDVDIPAIFGSYLIDFRFDLNQVTNEFFACFYQSDLFKSQLNKIIQASANTNINAENIKSTTISLPSIDEQKKIGEYFQNLDNLIASQEQELEGYKELKKGLLQQMFC